jgi:hypothetical protein
MKKGEKKGSDGGWEREREREREIESASRSLRLSPAVVSFPLRKWAYLRKGGRRSESSAPSSLTHPSRIPLRSSLPARRGGGKGGTPPHRGTLHGSSTSSMHHLRRGSTTRAAAWEEASYHDHTGKICPTTSPALSRTMEPRPKVNARRSLWMRMRGWWRRRRQDHYGGEGEVGG